MPWSCTLALLVRLEGRRGAGNGMLGVGEGGPRERAQGAGPAGSFPDILWSLSLTLDIKFMTISI